MKDVDLKKFMKRYDGFKQYNLPVPFFDEERQVLEYVYYDDNSIASQIEENPLYDNKLMIDADLVNALGNITYSGFYYSYNSKIYKYHEDGTRESVVGHTHAHAFSEVVNDLYYYPESFSINSDEEQYFSEQELKYLKRVQAYLLFIGLIDVSDIYEERDNSRYNNALQHKYGMSYLKKCTNKDIEDVLNGTKVLEVRKCLAYDENHKLEDYRNLMMNDDYQIKVWVLYNNSRIMLYKDIKDKCQLEDCSDDEKVVVADITILEKY